MGLAKKVDLLAEDKDIRGKEVSGALFKQFNELHSKDFWDDKEIEQVLLKQKSLEVEGIGVRGQRPSMYIFSPSGASKCERELYYKILGEKQVVDKFPYHRRWTRNATAVHEVVQRDLLYSEKLLENPYFKVKRMDNGLPAWESNLKNYKIYNHNGYEFAILGMMDGILTYKDGTDIGFEFKTKSNSVGQVGHYKMKDIDPSHKQQCTAYSLLFGMDEFIVMYESVAKDGWMKGPEAKMDIRTFYYKVTEEDRQLLLDKFASVVADVKNNDLSIARVERCIFCPYKQLCPSSSVNQETKEEQ